MVPAQSETTDVCPLMTSRSGLLPCDLVRLAWETLSFSLNSCSISEWTVRSCEKHSVARDHNLGVGWEILTTDSQGQPTASGAHIVYLPVYCGQAFLLKVGVGLGKVLASKEPLQCKTATLQLALPRIHSTAMPIMAVIEDYHCWEAAQKGL